MPNITEDLESSSAGPEYLEQGDSKAADNQTYELPSIVAADIEEDYMPEFTQYIGYVQETNGYYNFWPVCVVYDGTVERFDAVQEVFDDLGNINLASTP